MMKNKMISVLLIVFCMVFCFTAAFSATADIENEEGSAEDIGETIQEDPVEVIDETSSESDNNISASLGNDCLCGREYYTENVGEHSKYDCIKCGKNMYACTCNCWCGASSKLDTSGQYGSVLPRLRSGCQKPCPQCDCRDNKAEILHAEKLRINGEVSPLNLPRPENGLNISIALFTMLLISACAFYLPYAPFFKNTNTVSDNVDLVDLLFKQEDETTSVKPEKVYETPEDFAHTSKRAPAKSVNTGRSGISIYEKINLPWISSDNRIIHVNAVAASIMVNDSDVIHGDEVAVGEISEQLMSRDSSELDRVARFPEFFGTAVDDVSEDGKEGEV